MLLHGFTVGYPINEGLQNFSGYFFHSVAVTLIFLSHHSVLESRVKTMPSVAFIISKCSTCFFDLNVQMPIMLGAFLLFSVTMLFQQSCCLGIVWRVRVNMYHYNFPLRCILESCLHAAIASFRSQFLKCHSKFCPLCVCTAYLW